LQKVLQKVILKFAAICGSCNEISHLGTVKLVGRFQTMSSDVIVSKAELGESAKCKRNENVDKLHCKPFCEGGQCLYINL
jgi:hypothetical protein